MKEKFTKYNRKYQISKEKIDKWIEKLKTKWKSRIKRMKKVCCCISKYDLHSTEYEFGKSNCNESEFNAKKLEYLFKEHDFSTNDHSLKWDIRPITESSSCYYDNDICLHCSFATLTTLSSVGTINRMTGMTINDNDFINLKRCRDDLSVKSSNHHSNECFEKTQDDISLHIDTSLSVSILTEDLCSSGMSGLKPNNRFANSDDFLPIHADKNVKTNDISSHVCKNEQKIDDESKSDEASNKDSDSSCLSNFKPFDQTDKKTTHNEESECHFSKIKPDDKINEDDNIENRDKVSESPLSKVKHNDQKDEDVETETHEKVSENPLSKVEHFDQINEDDKTETHDKISECSTPSYFTQDSLADEENKNDTGSYKQDHGCFYLIQDIETNEGGNEETPDHFSDCPYLSNIHQDEPSKSESISECSLSNRLQDDRTDRDSKSETEIYDKLSEAPSLFHLKQKEITINDTLEKGLYDDLCLKLTPKLFKINFCKLYDVQRCSSVFHYNICYIEICLLKSMLYTIMKDKHHLTEASVKLWKMDEPSFENTNLESLLLLVKESLCLTNSKSEHSTKENYCCNDLLNLMSSSNGCNLYEIKQANETEEDTVIQQYHDIVKLEKIRLGNTTATLPFDLGEFRSFVENNEDLSYSKKDSVHSLKLLLRKVFVKTSIKTPSDKTNKKKKHRLYKLAQRQTLQDLMKKFFEQLESGFPDKPKDSSLQKLYKQIFDYLPFRYDNTFFVYPIHGLKQYFDEMSASNRPAHVDTMRFEWVRIRSFWSFPSIIRISPLHLARVGFYYTGKVSETKCFCCGATYKDWKEGDDPYAIHQQISPTCSYLRGNDNNNVPVHEEDRRSPRPQVVQTMVSTTEEPRGAEGQIGAMALPGTGAADLVLQQDPSVLPGQSVLGQSSQLGTGFFNPPSISQPPTTSNNFSFGVPTRPQAPPTSTPSQALGRPDQQGPSISPPRLQFNEGSNAGRPTQENAPQSMSASQSSSTSQPSSYAVVSQGPTAQMPTTAAASTGSIQERSAGGLPSLSLSSIGQGNTAATQTSERPEDQRGGLLEGSRSGGGESGLPTSSSNDASNRMTSSSTEPSRQKFDPLGINFEKPRYPAYAVLTVRVSTYNGWPAYLDQTPRDMALAGFFYAGHGDYTRCFFCGGGLRNWEAGDDPWIEHARWFPRCAFLRQNKGERYVNMVQQRHQEAEAANSPMVLPVPAPAVMEGSSQPSDIMSSVCVQSLREMGKSNEIIREAIKRWQNIKKPGLAVEPSDLQATEIYEIILQIEEERSARQLQAARPQEPQSVAGGATAGELTESTGGSSTQPEGSYTEDFDKMYDEYTDLTLKLTCKICQDQPVALAFLPCGHLVCCLDCAPAMRRCPSCQEMVRGTIKTFFP